MKKILFVFIAFVFLQSCKDAMKNKENSIKQDTSSQKVESTSMHSEDLFKNVVFDSKNDLVCGMPTSAGVSDTAHYKGKIYGFCSSECKAEFVKNPSSLVATK